MSEILSIFLISRFLRCVSTSILCSWQNSKAKQPNRITRMHNIQKFAEFLYPLCEKGPEFIDVVLVGSVRR